MDKGFDVAVLGAGPAGLASAITLKAKNPEARVLLIEKNPEVGKKLSASGNGKGNLSNEACPSLNRVLRFFTESNIATVIDREGRVYPYSEDASAVTEALKERALYLGVNLVNNCKVENVEIAKDGFHIFVLGKEEYLSTKLIIAMGGKSYPKTGSSGEGYELAKKLGHTVTKLAPGLTAVEVKEDISTLKGVRAKAKVYLREIRNQGDIFIEQGEVQFKEDSISGIVIMNLSSCLPIEREFENLKVVLDLVPDMSLENLAEFLRESNNLEKTMETIVRKPLANYILKLAPLSTEKCTDEALRLAGALKKFELTPTGRKGWKDAQVTRGGIDLDEIEMSTMESKLVNGLYFAGEIVDYDGPCGGYNLNNAFYTGIVAGESCMNK